MKEAGEQAELLVNDVLDISDLTGPYDLILDIGCFHGISQDEVIRYSENLERLLAPGGYFLLYAFIKEPGGSHTGLVEIGFGSSFCIPGNGRPSRWNGTGFTTLCMDDLLTTQIVRMGKHAQVKQTLFLPFCIGIIAPD